VQVENCHPFKPCGSKLGEMQVWGTGTGPRSKPTPRVYREVARTSVAEVAEALEWTGLTEGKIKRCGATDDHPPRLYVSGV
jgi:hypothetical protein